MSSNGIPLLEASEFIKPMNAEQSMSDLLESFKGGKIEQSNIHAGQEEVSVRGNDTKHSMAAFLDSFQENNVLPHGDAEVVRHLISNFVSLYNFFKCWAFTCLFSIYCPD